MLGAWKSSLMSSIFMATLWAQKGPVVTDAILTLWRKSSFNCQCQEQCRMHTPKYYPAWEVAPSSMRWLTAVCLDSCTVCCFQHTAGCCNCKPTSTMKRGGLQAHSVVNRLNLFLQANLHTFCVTSLALPGQGSLLVPYLCFHTHAGCLRLPRTVGSETNY